MYKRFFKRIIDFSVALVALIVLSPLLLIVTVWLHFANKGAGAFFLQERPGLHSKVFKIIKYKTMTDERGPDGELLPDGERLTRVGRFVRSTSIDELPQLINVLKGDMSLIGPRPLLTRYLPYYTQREQLRHTVRPGITGWAQIHGRNESDWYSKLELDAQYAEHVSFLLDAKIFFITIKKVFKREGAIADKKEHYLDVERQNMKI
ncbi:MAG: sugar transferase [Muribaculaceae bacterium]|nr:sugar transferase [Muribaculaceae bacterium]